MSIETIGSTQFWDLRASKTCRAHDRCARRNINSLAIDMNGNGTLRQCCRRTQIKIFDGYFYWFIHGQLLEQRHQHEQPHA